MTPTFKPALTALEDRTCPATMHTNGVIVPTPPVMAPAPIAIKPPPAGTMGNHG